MPRRRSLTSQLYRAARLSADVDAALRGPVPYAKRQARKPVYRATNRATRGVLRFFGLSG